MAHCMTIMLSLKFGHARLVEDDMANGEFAQLSHGMFVARISACIEIGQRVSRCVLFAG